MLRHPGIGLRKWWHQSEPMNITLTFTANPALLCLPISGENHGFNTESDV